MRRFSRMLLSQVALTAGFVAFSVIAGTAPLAADKPVRTEKGTKLAKARDEAKPATPVILASKDALHVAARVDELIATELKKANAAVASRCSDEDFLRRVSFDIAGTSPTTQEVTLFGLDPDSRKREKLIDRLLGTDDYAQNWMRYWRDVIFMRATEMRAGIARQAFQTWLTEQLKTNTSWDAIATAMVTATGDVQEKGETALIFAQSGDAKEIAAETSRIFLGIQMQCANCHDHPTDKWKRKDFHELAAFFPRIQLINKMQTTRSFEVVSAVFPPGGMRGGPGAPGDLLRDPERLIKLLDRDGDGLISKEEGQQGPGVAMIFPRLLEFGDTNKDGKLSLEELKKIPPPMMNQRRGFPEHFMPDLQNPQSQGLKVDPAFFVNHEAPGTGLGDMERRQTLARYLTAKDNPWFARAFVNRIWGELLGEGFYMPIDDIGPERAATYPAALDTLAAGFTANGYDIRWLFRAIANSETYQRQIRPRDPSQANPPFASAMPVRLRSDQLYTALQRVLNFSDEGQFNRPFGGAAGFRGGDQSPRGQFNQLFGVDPSTTPDDVAGTIPQALLMMNGRMIGGFIRAEGQTRLAGILRKYPDNKDAVIELYLLVHAREPSAKELQVCQDHLKDVTSRSEAFEDILWSLLNSTEFQTKR